MPLSPSQPGPRRRVAGSRRRSSDTPEPAARPAATDTAERTRRHTLTGLRWPLLALALAIALLATALVHGLRPALADADRAAAVGSARTTLESVLSYSGKTFDEHVAEVTPLLAAPFKDEFTQVARTDIKPLAEKNQATVQARVQEAGVMDTTGDGGAGTVVRVMAFVNQATTSKVQKTPAVDQNRVIATMTRVGDRWLLSALEAY